MSDQDKQGSGGNEGSAIIMVDQAASHVKPYRPTDLKNDSDIHHKRSRAPAVPSVAEELKKIAEDTTVNENIDSKESKEIERTMSSEQNNAVTKKSSKRRDLSPEIPLASLGVDSKKDSAKSLQSKSIPSAIQPIPPQIKEEKSEASIVLSPKEETERMVEEDSITNEITELRTSEEAKKHSEWSDDEEAGGLPRSESRASRVSRAVRQLFCCGVRYEAASEDNISSRNEYGI